MLLRWLASGGGQQLAAASALKKIDTEAFSKAMNEELINQLTLAFLLQMLRTDAMELTIGPASKGGSPIRYRVGGTWYDMSPQTAQFGLVGLDGKAETINITQPDVVTQVVAELGRLAGFSSRPFPKEALIDVLWGAHRLRWVVRAACADADYVLTPIEQ